ncbi:MAG: hypothetical protein WC343_05505 [Bacilli bacterium]
MNGEDIEDICYRCDHTGSGDEDGEILCLKSPAPPPVGVSGDDLRASGIDPDDFYFAICDLEKCPLGKWQRSVREG